MFAAFSSATSSEWWGSTSNVQKCWSGHWFRSPDSHSLAGAPSYLSPVCSPSPHHSSYFLHLRLPGPPEQMLLFYIRITNQRRGTDLELIDEAGPGRGRLKVDWQTRRVWWWRGRRIAGVRRLAGEGGRLKDVGIDNRADAVWENVWKVHSRVRG